MFHDVLEELIEWAEDVASRSIGSRVVVLPIPSGWGRTFLLDRLANAVDPWPNTLQIEVSGRSCPQGDGPAAEWLWDLSRPEPLAHNDDADDREGSLQLAGGAAALTATPALEGPAGLLVAVGLAADAGLRDLLFPNPAARARQAGRRLGALRPEGLVLVEIDDAEMLPGAIVEAFLTGLVERFGGRVLGVVVADRSSDLVTRLQHLPSPSPLAEGLRWVDIPNAGMDAVARREMIGRVVPEWPLSATNRLAKKTRTSKDIYTVLCQPRAKAIPGSREPELEVDRLVMSALPPGHPSDAESVVAWSGGELHEKQLTAALALMGTDSAGGRVTKTADVLRLADPARRAELHPHWPAFNVGPAMAQAIAQIATASIRDESLDWVSNLALLRPIPALIESKDLSLAAEALELVMELVALLCRTGDLQAARGLATRMTAEALRNGTSGSGLDRLAAAAFALAATGNATDAVEGLALEAVDPDGTGAFDVEAQLWASVCLLQNPATRDHGVAAGKALLSRHDRGCLASRLHFAAAAARAQDRTAAQEALIPLFALPEHSELRQLAHHVMTLRPDRQADCALAIALLDRDLSRLSSDQPEELLRLHLVLANLHQRVGNWHDALRHQSLALTHIGHLAGPDHADMLHARYNFATYVARAGDGPRARSLLEDLLPVLIRVMGEEDQATLAVRGDIAHLTGQVGDGPGAVQLLEALLADQVRVLGRDHPHALATRENIAAWTGQAGDPNRALQLYRDLLHDQARVFGPDHPSTLITRNNIALRTAQIGVGTRALHLYEALLPDAARVLGADHPHTLATRGNIAAWTGQAGDPGRAVHLYEDLLADQLRVLGTDHPQTLATRHSIASWVGRAGNADRARHLSESLLPDMVRLLGNDHPHTLATRESIAAWSGQAGDPLRALQLYQELLPVQVRVLGPTHPLTLATRNQIALRTAQIGAGASTLQLYEALMLDALRVLGPDHPHTLAARGKIAASTGQAGDPGRALQLYQDLGVDQVRVLGADHPDTLATRDSIASWSGRAGDTDRALHLSEALLPDMVRVLGIDHPRTLAARESIAAWAGQAGNPVRALRLYKELLADQVRVLGTDHRDTLATRKSIPSWMGRAGNDKRARQLLENLLPDLIRVLGHDHPDALVTRTQIKSLKIGIGPN